MSEPTVEEAIVAKFGGDTPEAPTQAVETAETDDATETTETEAVAGNEPVLLAGKYKTNEELERGYRELETELGRQRNEIGELRQIREELAGVREAVTQPAGQAYDPGSVDEFLAMNPDQAPGLAQQALESQDNFLYGKALQAWHDNDPLTAAAFHAQVVTRAEIAPFLKIAQEQQHATGFQAAFQSGTARHPDFADVINNVTEETIAGFPPEILEGLKSGDQASKDRVLETLYRWVKAEQAGNLTAAAHEAVAQQQQQTVADKQAATVATTSAARDHLTPPVAQNDAWRQQFRESDAFKKHSAQT